MLSDDDIRADAEDLDRQEAAQAGRVYEESGQAVAPVARQSHPEQRDLQGHLVIRQDQADCDRGWKEDIRQPRDTWVGVPFPPLVDERTWGRVQSLKKQRLLRAKRNTRLFYMLQHIVKCAECGRLLGARTSRTRTTKRNGKAYRYQLDPPRRYYQCYGMKLLRLRCRKKAMIRAERLEDLVWGEVKKVLQHPEVIVSGVNSLDMKEDGGLAKDIAGTERDLRNVQLEEDRAIRLYVSGKITEDQLDHQSRFITERLETLRDKLDEHHAQESMADEKRVLMENLVEWAGKFGEGLDDLSSEERRNVLLLLVDQVLIDGEDNVNITLGIPTEDLVSIASPPSCSLFSNRHEKLRYSWAGGL